MFGKRVDLYIVGVVYGWKHVGGDEVGVVGKPAHQEEGHHAHHHLHHLGINVSTNITIIIIIIVRKRDTTPIIIFTTWESI